MLDVPAKQDVSTIGWLLDLQPSTSWESELLQLLHTYPRAVVGEFGLDRAAVIPGTKVSSEDIQAPGGENHLSLARHCSLSPTPKTMGSGHN